MAPQINTIIQISGTNIIGVQLHPSLVSGLFLFFGTIRAKKSTNLAIQHMEDREVWWIIIGSNKAINLKILK